MRYSRNALILDASTRREQVLSRGNAILETCKDSRLCCCCFWLLSESTMYLRESEIKQVAQLIKDEKLRNRVLTLMRSHRRIVSAPEKENRNIREVASAQMLGQG